MLSRFKLFLCSLLIVCLGFFAGLSPAAAQTTTAETIPAPANTAATVDFDAVAIQRIHASLTELRARAVDLFAAARELPAGIEEVGARLEGGVQVASVEDVFSGFLLIVIVGGIACFLTQRALGRWSDGVMQHSTRAYSRVLANLCKALLPALVFALVSIGVYVSGWNDSGGLSQFLLLLVHWAVAALVVFRLLAMVFAVEQRQQRLVALDDRQARVAHYCLTAGISLLGLVTLLIHFASGHALAPSQVLLLNLATTLVLAFFVATAATIISRCVPDGAQIQPDSSSATGIAGFIERRWGGLTAVAAFFVWATCAIAVLLGVGAPITEAVVTALAVLAIPLISRGVDRIALRSGMQALVSTSAEATDEYRQVELAEDARLARRFASSMRATMIAVVVLALWTLWLGEFPQALSSGLSGRLFRAGTIIVITLLMAYAAWIWIDRWLRNPIMGPPGTQSLPQSRLTTVRPILRNTIVIALVIISTMIVLTELGVKTGPLLAGAGIIGIALSFGSQYFIRDVISGTFYLIDDAFRVGEYVEVGKLRGTVEGLTIRSMQVRHHRGALHNIPFGEIKSLTNYSRDWTIVKITVPVPHDTDIVKLKKIIKGVSAELMTNEDFAPHIIEPLKSQGVDSVDDVGLIVRLKFMARPGQQFSMKREALRMVQEALAANGIEFARRRVVVETHHRGGDAESAKALEQIAEATAAAVASIAVSVPGSTEPGSGGGPGG